MVSQGETFGEGRSLVELYDFPDLGQKIINLRQEIKNANRLIDSGKAGNDLGQTDRARQTQEIQGAKATREGKEEALEQLPAPQRGLFQIPGLCFQFRQPLRPALWIPK